MDFHFASAWERVADKYPNRVATISDNKALPWAEFERRASCIASLLEKYGLGPGSKAGLYLHNSSEYQEAQFGILKSAAVQSTSITASQTNWSPVRKQRCRSGIFQSCYAMRIWEIRERLPGQAVYSN